MKSVTDAFKKLNAYFQGNFEVNFKSFSKILSDLVNTKILIADYKKNIVSSWPEGLYDVLLEEYLALVGRNTLENVILKYGRKPRRLPRG